MTDEWFARHRAMLDLAAAALVAREGFAPYGSDPEDFPEGSEVRGLQAFEACCNANFHIDQPSIDVRVGEEISPYRGRLGILYPAPDVERMLTGAVHAAAAWSRVDLMSRTGLCLEVLDRLRLRVFELAHAVMHTTGAPFDVALRIGGLQALARSLEAVAIAHQEQESLPVHGSDRDSGASAVRFQPLGRGIGLVIGCGSMPTWTGFPALFANVATGNAVVVKPHPRSILPWAIAVSVLREVLVETGFNSGLVSLAVEGASPGLARLLARRDEVRLIDYTGGEEFGAWLCEHATQARQWRFGSATNAVIVESLDDLDEFLAEFGRAARVYAGRLCTSPRVLLIARAGVRVKGEVLDPDTFLGHVARHVEGHAGAEAMQVLGAVWPDEFDMFLSGAMACGEVLAESRMVFSDGFPGATARSPALIRVDAASVSAFRREWFGPLLVAIEAEDIAGAVLWAQVTARDAGMLRAQVWSVDAGTRRTVQDALAAAGVEVIDRAGDWTDVPMAFRDLHGSGMNRAANTTLGAAEFVVGRFHHGRKASEG